MQPSTPPADGQTGSVITCRADEGFAALLSRLPGSVAITTYQAGKLIFLGWDGTQVCVFSRHFDKPMGLAVNGPRLALATRHEVTLFADAPLLAHEFLHDQPGRYDALHLPRATFHTGDLNVHDLAFADDGLWLVNTRFGCLASLSSDFSFVPRWKPKFISQLAPEDRCHLNGLAVVAGKPRYVTALGQTDAPGAWRKNKATGGVVIDIASGEVVTRGLAMPHSPRWQGGALWVLNSGAGELWRIDPTTGKHDVICALPGYLRGLCLLGGIALVGMCQIRERHIFGDLPVQSRFTQLTCGVAVIDLSAGRQVGLLEFPTGCQELFEVAFVPHGRRPMILSLDLPETRQAFTAPEFSYWLRPQNEIPLPPDSAEGVAP